MSEWCLFLWYSLDLCQRIEIYFYERRQSIGSITRVIGYKATLNPARAAKCVEHPNEKWRSFFAIRKLRTTSVIKCSSERSLVEFLPKKFAQMTFGFSYWVILRHNPKKNAIWYARTRAKKIALCNNWSNICFSDGLRPAKWITYELNARRFEGLTENYLLLVLLPVFQMNFSIGVNHRIFCFYF